MKNVLITTEEGFELRGEIVDLIKNQPTFDEKEIIRKAFERAYKRMKAISYREEPNDCDPFGDVPHYVVSLSAIKQILKEECGINE
jgi:hypothetical protein